jgi:hypothetical protein
VASIRFFHKPPIDILVQDAGDEGLIGEPFTQGGLLEVDEITLRHSDIYALVFAQGGSSRFAVAGSLLLEVCDTLPFSPFNRIEQFVLFPRQFHFLSPPGYNLVIFRLGMIVFMKMTSSSSTNYVLSSVITQFRVGQQALIQAG